MDHYTEVNKAYLEFFTSDPKPVTFTFYSKHQPDANTLARAEPA